MKPQIRMFTGMGPPIIIDVPATTIDEIAAIAEKIAQTGWRNGTDKGGIIIKPLMVEFRLEGFENAGILTPKPNITIVPG